MNLTKPDEQNKDKMSPYPWGSFLTFFSSTFFFPILFLRATCWQAWVDDSKTTSLLVTVLPPSLLNCSNLSQNAYRPMGSSSGSVSFPPLLKWLNEKGEGEEEERRITSSIYYFQADHSLPKHAYYFHHRLKTLFIKELFGPCLWLVRRLKLRLLAEGIWP